MKAIVIIIILSVLTIDGFSQRKIKKLDIKEEGISVNVEFQPIIDQTELNGISVKISPISADELNRKFVLSNQLNGKFNYSYYEKTRDEYFLKKQKIRKEKTDLEFLLEGIDWLVENEKINKEECDIFKSSVISEYIPDYKSEPLGNDDITYSNPYYLGSVYMNVFKIEFVNPTNTIVNFNENLIIKSGVNNLTCLSSDFLKSELKNSNTLNLNKSFSLGRYNLDLPLLLPPKSTTVKYFSVLPLDLNSDKIDITISNANQPLSWKVIKTQDVIDKKYAFYEIAIAYKYAGIESTSGINYSILSNNEKQVAYLVDNKFFINSDETKAFLEVITFALKSDELFFSRQTINGSNYLDIAKNRRSTIIIDTEKITEVKRKIKQ